LLALVSAACIITTCLKQTRLEFLRSTAVAHAYIQHERLRRGSAGLTFPAVRAIVQEIFTALLFAAKPRYMHWMEEAKRNLQLRI